MAVWHQACLNLQAHPYLLSAPVCTAPLYRPAVPPVPQAIAVLTGLALCTEAVLACADIVVTGGGLPVLLGIAQASGRSKEAAEALRAALHCLTNISRSRWAGRLVGRRVGQDSWCGLGACCCLRCCYSSSLCGGSLCGGSHSWTPWLLSLSTFVPAEPLAC